MLCELMYATDEMQFCNSILPIQTNSIMNKYTVFGRSTVYLK